MGFPIKVCVVCGEEFELRPDKPGFANRCWSCSTEEAAEKSPELSSEDAVDRRVQQEMDAARRKAIRNMLYSRDS
jgi:hypothetical protein